jgi:hypothetical protein
VRVIPRPHRRWPPSGIFRALGVYPADGSADEEHPRTAEAAAADESARAIIAEALQMGQWTERDRARLREAMASADAESRTEAMRQFSVAVNSGKLHLQVAGPPF